MKVERGSNEKEIVFSFTLISLHTYRKNLLLMGASFVSIIKNIMKKDKKKEKIDKAAKRQYNVPFPKLKPKQWIAFAVALLYNTTMTDTYGWPDGGFLGTLLGIICAFGVVLGEPVFKLVTPQEHYIKKAKLNLIITEWFVSVFIGVGLYAALVFLLF